MPRQARLDAPQTLPHVMVQGLDRQGIFRDDRDRAAFLDRLQGLAEHDALTVPAWALRPNHSHLGPDRHPSLGRDCRYPPPIRLPGCAAVARGGGEVDDLGLDQNWGNSATQVIQARIPAGTTLYEGVAAAQRGLVGSGSQTMTEGSPAESGLAGAGAAPGVLRGTTLPSTASYDFMH